MDSMVTAAEEAEKSWPVDSVLKSVGGAAGISACSLDTWTRTTAVQWLLSGKDPVGEPSLHKVVVAFLKIAVE